MSNLLPPRRLGRPLNAPLSFGRCRGAYAAALTRRLAGARVQPMTASVIDASGVVISAIPELA